MHFQEKRNCFILLLEYLEIENFMDKVKEIPYAIHLFAC